MSRRILTFAQKIAQDMKSSINSEHILLALATTPNTFAYEILRDQMVSVDQIRLTLSLRGSESKLSAGISAKAKKILELAVKAAIDFKQTQVNPEHFLYAIVAYPESWAYQTLVHLEVNPKKIREALEKILTDLNKIKNESQQILEASLLPLVGAFPKAPHLLKTKTGALHPPASVLEIFAVNLTREAEENKLDPVVEREEETDRVMQILCRRTKNNPVLVGDPGVGKTAIVESLAQKITSQTVPEILKRKQIWRLDMALLVAGTTFRGQFEERIKAVIEEVIQSPNIILFIDEIHTLVGAGNVEGALDASNIFKPSLAKGQLRLIGATTDDEYRQYIESDPALARRMQKVYIEQPSEAQTIKILNSLKEKYGDYHHITITQEAIEAAVSLSQNYISDRFLPDKAIDLIDEACASVQLKAKPLKEDPKIEKLQRQLEIILETKEKAIQQQDFDLAAQIRSKELETIRQIFLKKHQKKAYSVGKIIALDIAKIVSAWTNIPLENLILSGDQVYKNIDQRLKKQVFGQDEAIGVIASAIKRAKTGIANLQKPLGSFLFLGPTGVGKTYLARVLAEELFGSENALIRLDMSEFTEKHTVSRLIGAPPGYIGYENAGELTEAVRTKPHAIILLDEIEKAHPEVSNILLQILDNGFLTDASGRKANFRQTVIIATSNLGSEKLADISAIGFRKNQNKIADYQQSLKEHFRPELLGRFNKILFFNPLNKETIKKIIEKWLAELNQRLPKSLKISLPATAIEKLIAHGYDPLSGARSLEKIWIDEIENALADFILADKKDQKNLTVKINPQTAVKINIHYGRQ